MLGADSVLNGFADPVDGRWIATFETIWENRAAMTAILWMALAITGVAFLQVLMVTLQTWEHVRNVARRRRPKLNPDSLRPALVIVPVKGSDPGLEHALEALFLLDYPDVRLCFVGESDHEPARRILQCLRRRYPLRAAEWRTAGLAHDCGQKVHNLLAALDDVPDEIEVLAFVDADATIRPDWLTLLVQRFSESKISGAATGYRDLIPGRPTFANQIVYTLNSMAAGMLGPRSLHNCIWGGSWAIRRSTFDSLKIADAWRGLLDDDYVATNVLGRHRLRVGYEPLVMACSEVDWTLAQASEFTSRQLFITRVYAPRLWWLVFVGWTASLLALLALPILGLIAWRNNLAWASFPLIGWLVVYFSASARAIARQWVARTARPLVVVDRATRWFEILLHPAASVFGYAALMRSGLGRSIAWRNVAYRLDEAGKVLEIRRLAADPRREGGDGCSENRAA